MYLCGRPEGRIKKVQEHEHEHEQEQAVSQTKEVPGIIGSGKRRPYDTADARKIGDGCAMSALSGWNKRYGLF